MERVGLHALIAGRFWHCLASQEQNRKTQPETPDHGKGKSGLRTGIILNLRMALSWEELQANHDVVH